MPGPRKPASPFLGDVILDGSAVAPPPPTLWRDEAVAAYVEGQRVCGSSSYAFDETWLAELGARSFDRACRPDGIMRQLPAMMRSGERRSTFGSIEMPTAIIHGRDDRLVKTEASIERARLISSAELHLYPGLGHQVAKPLWDDFAAIIERTVGRA